MADFLELLAIASLVATAYFYLKCVLFGNKREPTLADYALSPVSFIFLPVQGEAAVKWRRLFWIFGALTLFLFLLVFILKGLK